MANVYGLIFEIDDKTKAGATSINRNLNKISGNADRVKKALGGIGSVASSAVGALGKTAAAATAAAGAFAFLAKKNLDALDNLGKTANKLGVTTEFLSSYGFVAKQAGLSTDQFNTGLQRFIRRLGQAQQGSGELVKPLQQLGINMRDSNGNFREGTDVFQEFLTKLGNTTNNAQKLALAMGAFDTEGVAFINIADMGATAIERLRREAELAGLVIDERLAKGAERANDSISSLLARARGFSLQFFGALAPGIETLTQDITNALDEAVAGSGGMEQFARGLAGDFMRGTATFLDTLAMLFDGFRNSLATATNIIQRLLVSISPLIPDATFAFDTDVNLSGLRERKQEILTEMKDIADELEVPLEDMFNRLGGVGGFDALFASITNPTLHRQLQNLNQEFNKVVSEIGQIENGSTIVFTKMATDSTAAQDALAGTTDQLRQMAETLSAGEVAMTNEALQDMVQNAIDSAKAAEEARVSALKAIYEPANQLVESLKPVETEYQKLEQRLLEVQNAQALLVQGFNNGINRMGAGYQATMAFKEAMTLLAGESERVRAAMEQLAREATYLEKPENQLIDRHTELSAELDKVQLAMIRVRAEMALAQGDTAGYAYALRQLTDEEKRLKEQLEGRTSTSNSANTSVRSGIVSFKEYADALRTTATNTVNEAKYLQTLKQRLDAAAASTTGLTKVQQEQLDMVNERLKQMKDEDAPAAFNVVERLNSSMEGMIGTVSSTFADVLLGLKDGFSSLQDLAMSALRMIISTLIEAFIRSQILGQSLNFGGGGFSFASLANMGGGLGGLGLGFGLGGMIAGFLADGGPASAGKPYVVGERGPELFVPNTSGTVVSNEDLSMTGGEVLTVNFNINAIDTQTGTQFIVENENTITGLIQRAYNRRGQSGPLG